MAVRSKMEEVLRAMSGHARRGPYRWLWEHYPELSAAKTGRTSWKAMAETMTALGVRTQDGRPLRGEAVRRAWLRVEEDVKVNGHPLLGDEQEHPEAPPDRSGGGTVTDLSAEPEQLRKGRFRSTVKWKGEE